MSDPLDELYRLRIELDIHREYKLKNGGIDHGCAYEVSESLTYNQIVERYGNLLSQDQLNRIKEMTQNDSGRTDTGTSKPI